MRTTLRTLDLNDNRPHTDSVPPSITSASSTRRVGGVKHGT